MGRRKTIDHIFPKSKGGTDNLNNLQFTHKRCNSIKGDKI
jgi:5-methylcytosine-specific restriction endonuclease McrA